MFGLPSPWLIGGSALLAFAAGGIGGYKAGEYVGSREVAREQVAAANWRADAAFANKALSDFVAQVETDRADANELARKQQSAQAAAMAAIRAQLATARKAAQQASLAHLEALRNARPEDTAVLSVSVRGYLRRLSDDATTTAPATP